MKEYKVVWMGSALGDSQSYPLFQKRYFVEEDQRNEMMDWMESKDYRMRILQRNEQWDFN